MGRLRIIPWQEATLALERIIRSCLGWRIEPHRIAVVVSCSSSTSIARVWGLPRIFQVAFGLEPRYVIEFVYRHASRLKPSELLDILAHELAHIPRVFSGGLRPHNSVFWREYRRLRDVIRGCSERPLVESLLAAMPDPCGGRS